MIPDTMFRVMVEERDARRRQIELEMMYLNALDLQVPSERGKRGAMLSSIRNLFGFGRGRASGTTFGSRQVEVSR